MGCRYFLFCCDRVLLCCLGIHHHAQLLCVAITSHSVGTSTLTLAATARSRAEHLSCTSHTSVLTLLHHPVAISSRLSSYPTRKPLPPPGPAGVGPFQACPEDSTASVPLDTYHPPRSTVDISSQAEKSQQYTPPNSHGPATRPGHPPMDWKPPDFFFFLFWARTISRVSGSTSDTHSEVGNEGRALPGPSCRKDRQTDGSTPALMDHGAGGPEAQLMSSLGPGWGRGAG